MSYEIVIKSSGGLPTCEIKGDFTPLHLRHVEISIHNAIKDLSFKRRAELGKLEVTQGKPKLEKVNDRPGKESARVGSSVESKPTEAKKIH